MARFYGTVGYGETVNKGQGIHEDVITERSYFGDVVRVTRSSRSADKVNEDFTMSNSISIVADSYATNHIFAIRYVQWEGALWEVTSVEVERPRLILRLGGVYNGPKAGSSGTP